MTAGPVSPVDRSPYDLALPPRRLCERCGYDLRELPEDRCPECGLAFDPSAEPRPRIPWLRREAIGGAQAFWQTVWLVTSSPRLFAAEFLRVNRVAAADARGFGQRCVALAVLSSVALCLFLASDPFWSGSDAAMLVLGGTIAASVFYALLARSSPFGPQQTTSPGEHVWLNALNGYAAAPLAFSPLPAAAACAAITAARADGGFKGAAALLWMVAAVGALGQFAVLWIGGLAMVRQVKRLGLEDTLWCALDLPIRWLLIALLTCLVMIALACPLAALSASFSG